VICRGDEDGKTVIFNYEDKDVIMTRELQPFDKWDVPVTVCDACLDKIKKRL